jgi:hypothetical protein
MNVVLNVVCMALVVFVHLVFEKTVSPSHKNSQEKSTQMIANQMLMSTLVNSL